VSVRDPSKGPVGLLFNAGGGLDRVKEVLPTSRVLDVRVNEERICFRVNVLHHDLEPVLVEGSGFSGLTLIRESLDKVLVDNAVRSGEEGEDMRDDR
jgi:hypothetical protein